MADRTEHDLEADDHDVDPGAPDDEIVDDGDRRGRGLRMPSVSMPRIDPQLGKRTAVAIPGIVLAIAAVYAGGVWFAVPAFAVACVGLLEFYSLTAATRPLRWAGYLGSFVMILLAWQHDVPPYGVLIGFAIGTGLVAIASLTVGRVEDITIRVAMTVLGLVYVGFTFAMLMALRELPHGAGAVANVLVGVWVFDSASYFGGKLWGTRRIAPRVSPGKTFEGFVVGITVGVLAVVVAGLYMDWLGAAQSLMLGIVICVSAFVGDLFESAVKRDVGAKDSGRILPGHGGVLDRFDGLMFATVATYFVTVAWIL